MEAIEMLMLKKADLEGIYSLLTELNKKVSQLSNSSKPGSDNPQWVSTKEAAKLLEVSLQTIHSMRKDGRLKAKRVGKLYRYNIDDLIGNPE